MKLNRKLTRTRQLFLGLACSSISNAFAVTAPATISFSYLNAGQPGAAAAYYGKANIAATDAQGCSSSVKCYFEAGFSVGSVIDPSDPNAHLHRGGTPSVRSIEYHGDSGGIYIRADDLSAFSLDSFKLDSKNNGTNPAAGTLGSNFEILGFKDALNADVTTWNWTADPTYGGKRVAYQLMPNDGSPVPTTIVLNDQFRNVKAIWIHYQGYPRVPTDGVEFDIKVIGIQLSAPLTICP
jgi:hypothetical protein